MSNPDARVIHFGMEPQAVAPKPPKKPKGSK